MIAGPAICSPPGRGRVLVAQAAAEGFAVGRSLRVPDAGVRTPAGATSPREVSLRDAVERVRGDLEQLARTLPRAEAELFEPEARILEEVAMRLLVREGPETLRDAVVAETSCGCTDLVIDLQVRLLNALEGSAGAELSAAAAHYGNDLVVVTQLVTPTMVASLPGEVVAVIGALDGEASARRDVGRTSHAAILARGRGLPVAFVTSDALLSIPNGSWIVVEASETRASVCIEPDELALAAARDRQTARTMERLEGRIGDQRLGHLGVELRVNVASPHDDIPDAASGVGLVRTEMMFAGRLTAPSESEQLAALLLITARARGRPVVVRLFDAGADKPLAWLGSEHNPARGIRRLLKHPEILATQLRALARAREYADVRVLLPFVRTADDVNAVRALASTSLQLGAMIESPDAAEATESIASAADFVSIGTNDLTATALGLERTAEAPLDHPKVLGLIRRIIRAAHARQRHVTICGEIAGHERGTRLAVGLGADALSVAPARLAAVHRVLGPATIEGCCKEAEEAIEGRTGLASAP